MQNITYLADGRAAIICITKEMLEKTGADMTMSEGIVEMIRDIDSVDLAVLLKEQDDSEIKVSMRSKRSIDVSGMALQNGGGGHARASGFSINNTNMGEALIFMKKLISENI